MAMKYKSGLLFSFIFLFLNLSAQNKECKVKELDKGLIKVKYCISRSYDEQGNEIITIKDSTTTIDHIDYDKCISLMKDVQKHKLFTGDSKSEIVRNIYDNEWTIYYYSDNPWPVKDSDCVSRMTFLENKEDKTATFELIATPLAYEAGIVNRMQYFNVKYTFEDLGNGNVKLTMTGASSPPVKVPMWLVKSAFPSTPANAIRKFIKLVRES
jgi:hypothetical protein